MKSLFPFFVLFLFPTMLAAQPTIKGRVVSDKDGKALAYATVVCYDGQKAIRAVTSTPDGRFNMLAGERPEYLLITSMVGFATDTLKIKMQPEGVDVGDVKLREGVEIGAVQVDGKRPLFEQQIDRYVYNVADDPDAKRLKMSEMMEKVPMLRMDAKGKLTFQDKDAVQIIVDGQRHELLSGRDYVMNFLRADIMGQIEIIPPGSPEYNNDKPIVNIKTVRRIPNGFALEVSGSGNTDNAWTAGVDFVSKIRDKVIVGMGYNVNFANRPDLHSSTLRETLTEGEVTDIQDSRRTNTGDNLGHNISLRGSTKLWGNSLNVGIKTNFGESNSSSLTEMTRTNGQGVLKETQTTQAGTTNTTKPRVNLDAGYSHLVGKQGYRLDYIYRYTDNLTESDSRSRIDFSGDRPFQGQISSNRAGAREHAAAVNFRWQVKPGSRIVKKHRVKAGLNYKDRKYDNLSERQRWDPLSMEYVPDYSYNPGMNYTQRILNAYMGYDYYNKKVTFSARLSPSYESSHGQFLGNGGTPLGYEKFNLRPSVSTNYRINSKYSTSLSYSMDVIRPDFAKLNPYVDATDSMNLRTGNPTLDPERSHNVGFGINRTFVAGRRAIWLDVLYSRIDKAVEQVVAVDPASGISTTTYANVGKRNNVTVKLDLWGIVAEKWLNISGGVAYDYVGYKSGFAGGRSGSQHAFSAGADVNLPLWKSARLWADYELRSDIGSPQNGGVNYQHIFNFQLSQMLVKNRVWLNLTLDNPFDSHRYIASSLVGTNFRSQSLNERRGRIFGFSLRCNFGRFRDRVGENANLTDDRSRATIPDNR